MHSEEVGFTSRTSIWCNSYKVLSRQYVSVILTQTNKKRLQLDTNVTLTLFTHRIYV